MHVFAYALCSANAFAAVSSSGFRNCDPFRSQWAYDLTETARADHAIMRFTPNQSQREFTMQIVCFFCLLIAAGPQTNSGPTSPPMANIDRNVDRDWSRVGSETPVLTIRGLCSQTASSQESQSSKRCETLVTRSQFEQLIAAIQPNADTAARRQIARAYPQLLIMAHEAHQRGLDALPEFEEKLAFARLQILSQALRHQIQKEAAEIPEKDIVAWYETHLDDFRVANLERIVMPNTRHESKASNDEHDAAKGNSVEDVLIKEANALRARAAAGEDFAKLQMEAYRFAGTAGNDQPNTRLLEVHRQSLQPGHAIVFDLKPGEVSRVISDSTGQYIYKLDSTEVQSIQVAQRRIVDVLRRQRVKDMMESVQKPFVTNVNTTYFGADTEAPSD